MFHVKHWNYEKFFMLLKLIISIYKIFIIKKMYINHVFLYSIIIFSINILNLMLSINVSRETLALF